MIIDLSDTNFKRIIEDTQLYLPMRWDGADFSSTLNNLFNYYINKLEMVGIKEPKHPRYIYEYADIKDIKRVCGLIQKTVDYYLNGFPSKAYLSFTKVMRILMMQPLKIYQKSVMEQFEGIGQHYDNRDNDLKLFRVVLVPDNRPYQRDRVFHTPYNLRSKVSTSRYSIAGYPSLYLGTSLDLCCKEINMNPYTGFALASLFKLERTLELTNTNIQVIELGVKPQDFIDTQEREGYIYSRVVSKDLLKSNQVRSAYLLWYPLIAASSYIRTNKNDPFAAEYIIPQLLMQWVRSEIKTSIDVEDEYDQLIGIRYFSCASVKASDMGFNYVFPTSGQQKSLECPYCTVLARAFRLTEPVYIHEHDKLCDCEYELKKKAFDSI